jgi:Sec-independent protein translocase protein TatA
MSETGIAGLFIALAILIVLSGPARLLEVLRAIVASVRSLRRPARRNRSEVTARE